MNSFGYENLDEVFFDVYQIKHKNVELVKEKKGEFNGNPIIELDLCIENEIFKNVRFLLKKQNGIFINPNLLDYSSVMVYEKTKKITKKVIKSIPVVKKIIKEEIIRKLPETHQVLKEETLIEKHKEEFFESVKGEIFDQFKNEIKQGIIAEMLKENLQSNFDSLLSENGNKNKLTKLFEQTNTVFRNEIIQLAEKLARRESMRFAESGGGTNAVQYSNGGLMDGSLTITNNLSAAQITANNITDTQGRELVSKLSFNVIGDGTRNSYLLNHNLNSKKVIINTYDGTSDEIVIPYTQITDKDNVLIQFSNNLELNEKYVVIIFG